MLMKRVAPVNNPDRQGLQRFAEVPELIALGGRTLDDRILEIGCRLGYLTNGASRNATWDPSPLQRHFHKHTSSAHRVITYRAMSRATHRVHTAATTPTESEFAVTRRF